MAIRLLAMDVDGTLVDLQDQVTAPVLDALRRARAAGLHLALATGRRYRSVLPLVEKLELCVPLVTTNGALIKDPATHHTLFQASFPDEVLQGLVAFFAQTPFTPLLYADTWHLGFDIYVPSLAPVSPQYGEFVDRNHDTLRLTPDLFEQIPPGVFACFGIGSQQEMLWLENQLQLAFPKQLDIHVLRSPKYTGYMCEISPAGVSKWTGVLSLAKALSVAPDEICAVGDDINDLPMIAAAGWGCAMANAPAPVLAAARQVVPTVEEDGLVYVVDRILRGLHVFPKA